MPSKEQTVDEAIRLFEAAHYPGELTPETAWLGIYQVLLWYEQVGIAEVCGFNDRLGNLFDLADLVKLTNLW